MDTLMSLRVFCTVAELRSFTAAAARLALSPAMASKHLAHLERRVGTRLLNRSSRRVSLTEAGALYFEQVRQSLDGLEEVEAAIGNVGVTPRGTLKISAPMWAASRWFAQLLTDYHRRYPEVVLDIDFSGRIVSLVDEGFDLALRATPRERLGPGLVARELMAVTFRLVGTPAHLNVTGRPAAVDDLNGRALLLYGGMNASGIVPVTGSAGQKTVRFDVVLRTENEIMLYQAALAGMGLAILPTSMTERDVATGVLETILPDQLCFSVPLHAVYPSGKYLSAKVRTFIDFFVAQERHAAVSA